MHAAALLHGPIPQMEGRWDHINRALPIIPLLIRARGRLEELPVKVWKQRIERLNDYERHRYRLVLIHRCV